MNLAKEISRLGEKDRLPSYLMAAANETISLINSSDITRYNSGNMLAPSTPVRVFVGDREVGIMESLRLVPDSVSSGWRL